MIENTKYAYFFIPAGNEPSDCLQRGNGLNGFEMSILICHDGTIYGYTSQEEVPQGKYEAYISNYLKNGCTKKEAQLKVLDALKRYYNIDFWEVG